MALRYDEFRTFLRADRIIGATALVEGLPLLTADSEIRRAGVFQTIW